MDAGEDAQPTTMMQHKPLGKVQMGAAEMNQWTRREKKYRPKKCQKDDENNFLIPQVNSGNTNTTKVSSRMRNAGELKEPVLYSAVYYSPWFGNTREALAG